MQADNKKIRNKKQHIDSLRMVLEGTKEEKKRLQMEQTLLRLNGGSYPIRGEFYAVKSGRKLNQATLETVSHYDPKVDLTLESRINDLYREIWKLEEQIRLIKPIVLPRPSLRWTQDEFAGPDLAWV